MVIFGLILVPGMFLSRVTSAINLGWKPHHVSYGLLISESSKIPLALMLVYFFDMGVLGVIISFFIAQNFAIVYQIYSIKEKIKGKIQFQYIRKWIKTSWLTLYTPLSDFIYKADILVFAAITQSVIGIAIFSVAAVISSIIIEDTRVIAIGIVSTLDQGGAISVRGKIYIISNGIITIRVTPLPGQGGIYGVINRNIGWKGIVRGVGFIIAWKWTDSYLVGSYLYFMGIGALLLLTIVSSQSYIVSSIIGQTCQLVAGIITNIYRGVIGARG